MERSHEELKELVPAFVLGAVSPEEMLEIRAHILACEECMSEADSYQEVAGALAVAVRSEPLPTGFADRVLARVDEIQGPALDRPQPRRRNLAALLVGGLGLVIVALLAVTLITTRQEMADNERLIDALVRGEGLELRGPGGAVARVVETDQGAVFIAAGLSEPPEELTYQVWFLREGEPTSAGTFEVSDGIGVLETERSLEGFDAAAVTVEPDGGSPEPRGKRVLVSDEDQIAKV